jgi:hypothetical protein
MARNWQNVAEPKGQDWGIPSAVMQNFASLITNAESTLEVAKNETARTTAATARCNEGFNAPSDEMRKKDLIQFDYSDGGKTVYFVAIENRGKQGTWKSLVPALIP